MANEQNLKPGEYKLTVEQAKKGGIASGKVRKEKASFKQAIKWLMESDIKITEGDIYETYKKQGIDISKFTPAQLATLGLWAGAVTGKNENFKTLMEANGEVQTDKKVEMPAITFNVQDNSTLEKVMYDENEED